MLGPDAEEVISGHELEEWLLDEDDLENWLNPLLCKWPCENHVCIYAATNILRCAPVMSLCHEEEKLSVNETEKANELKRPLRPFN